MNHLARYAVAILWVHAGAASLPAQSDLVVPAQYRTAEASSGGTIAGFSARFREQVLVSGAALQAANGSSLTSLSFRRDEALGKPYASASYSHLRVTISRAAQPVTAASRVFSVNRGASPLIVFDGLVALPATPAPPSPIPWRSPFVVRIPFRAALAYAGSDLCIELEGTPQNPPSGFFWWVDHDQHAVGGSVRHVGVPCGGPAAENTTTAGGWGRNAVPGSTFTLASFGRPSTPASLLLGPALSSPLSLGSIGAAGCTLYLQPAVSLSGTFPKPSPGTAYGLLHIDLHLASTPAFLGARFFAQWANVETGAQSNAAGLTTTNALDITIGSTLPSGPLSTVRSDVVAADEPFPSTGRVSISRGPVMRLEFH